MNFYNKRAGTGVAAINAHSGETIAGHDRTYPGWSL